MGHLLKLQLQLRPAWLDVLVHIRLCVARLGLSRGHRRVWPALLMTSLLPAETVRHVTPA